jgi:hypothetical protein
MTDLRQAAQQALHELEGIPFYRKYGVRISTAITALKAALEQSDAGIPVSGEWIGCGECDCIFKCYGGGKECIRLPVEQQAEPTPWRDMVVVSLVREGIDKHKARELADHFAAQQQAEPVAREGFNDWWNGDYDDSKNSYEPDSAAYWAWAGWQAAKRPWVGLTDEDVNRESAMIASQMKLAFHAGMYVAQEILKEKNT